MNDVAAFKSVDAGTTYALHVAGAGAELVHEASDVTEKASAAEAIAGKRSEDEGRSMLR